MRVALLTDGIYPFYVGGIQMHSFYMTKYLSKNKIYVDLYHPKIEEEKNFLSLFSLGEREYIQVFFVEFPKTKYFPGHYIYESYIYSKNIYNRLVQNDKYDFIYAQGFTAWKLLNKKNEKDISGLIGVNFHGINMFQPSFGIKGVLYRILFRYFVVNILKKTDIIFSLGANLTRLIRERVGPKANIIEIPIGIDANWLVDPCGLKCSQTRNFVFIGRFDRIKGIDVLNQAIRNLHKKGITPIFNFIGQIPPSSQLNFKNINYYGEIRNTDEIKKKLIKCDVLINPSYSEGMPTVILEAMSSGLAIIATDVGAVSEQVSVFNGILIKPGEVKELENAILYMCNLDEDCLLKLKKKSISEVKDKFLWDKIIAKTIEEIEKSIASKSV